MCETSWCGEFKERVLEKKPDKDENGNKEPLRNALELLQEPIAADLRINQFSIDYGWEVTHVDDKFVSLVGADLFTGWCYVRCGVTRTGESCRVYIIPRSLRFYHNCLGVSEWRMLMVVYTKSPYKETVIHDHTCDTLITGIHFMETNIKEWDH